jgi:hypothetical protein
LTTELDGSLKVFEAMFGTIQNQVEGITQLSIYASGAILYVFMSNAGIKDDRAFANIRKRYLLLMALVFFISDMLLGFFITSSFAGFYTEAIDPNKFGLPPKFSNVTELYLKDYRGDIAWLGMLQILSVILALILFGLWIANNFWTVVVKSSPKTQSVKAQ